MDNYSEDWIGKPTPSLTSLGPISAPGSTVSSTTAAPPQPRKNGGDLKPKWKDKNGKSQGAPPPPKKKKSDPGVNKPLNALYTEAATPLLTKRRTVLLSIAVACGTENQQKVIYKKTFRVPSLCSQHRLGPPNVPPAALLPSRSRAKRMHSGRGGEKMQTKRNKALPTKTKTILQPVRLRVRHPRPDGLPLLPLLRPLRKRHRAEAPLQRGILRASNKYQEEQVSFGRRPIYSFLFTRAICNRPARESRSGSLPT